MLHSIDTPVTTGTTIMALLYDQGVLLAADSRSTSGTYVADRLADKIDFVHDKIFVLRSGSAADTQTLARYVRYYLDAHSIELGHAPAVESAAKLFQNMIYQYKDQLSASVIVAGWDNIKGAQIYQVNAGGALFQKEWAIGGSGSTFIWGYVDHNFKSNMSLLQAKEFAKNSIAHAMARDNSSGGVIRMMSITEHGRERDFIDHNQLPFL